MMRSNTNMMGMAAGILMASASLAGANSFVLTQNAYSYDVGGEYSAATTDDFVAKYAGVATVNGEFETFCVETTVVAYPGLSYSYTLSDQDSQGRALSEGAAFLYYEFATGQLAGYDYADPSLRLADAGELQAAIWAFQGNQTYGQYPPLATDPFYELAINTFGTVGANSANNGRYDVDVLQLWDGSTAAQNQLVLTGVPDSPSTSGMLALACAGLVFLARRLNQQEPAAIVLTRRSQCSVS
jgi:hypothetical protein